MSDPSNGVPPGAQGFAFTRRGPGAIAPARLEGCSKSPRVHEPHAVTGSQASRNHSAPADPGTRSAWPAGGFSLREQPMGAPTMQRRGGDLAEGAWRPVSPPGRPNDAHQAITADGGGVESCFGEKSL